MREAVEGPVMPDCSASILQTHTDAVMLLDQQAASLLERRHALWECEP